MNGVSPRGATICNIYQMTTRPLPRQDPFACEDVQPHYRIVMSNTNSRAGEWYRCRISWWATPRRPAPRFSVTVFRRCRTQRRRMLQQTG